MQPINWLFKYALTIAMICREGVSTCGIHICLTWKIIPNHLVLTCKVHDLNQIVLFYNNFDKEQAYCLSPHPNTVCRNEYDNGTIYQNLNLNETIFSVRGIIDSRVNGNWTCRHGTSKDKANVEVTIPVPNVIEVRVMKTEGGCLKGPADQKHIEDYITSKIDRITCKPDCCRIVERVTYHKVAFIAILCVVILIPVAVGLPGNEKCYGISTFILLGILGMTFGILSSFFIWSAKHDYKTNSVEFQTTPVANDDDNVLESLEILTKNL